MQAAGAFWAVDDLAAEAPQPQRLAAGPWPGTPHCWALLPPAQSPSGCLEVRWTCARPAFLLCCPARCQGAWQLAWSLMVYSGSLAGVRCE